MPKTVGKCIDRLFMTRERRLAYQRRVEAVLEKMKEREAMIEEHIITSFSKTDIEGARGSLASASLSRLVVPNVRDWPAAFKWIEEHHAWDLMEKRMARIAYRDRLEAEQQIAGVEPFIKTSLHITRITKEK